MTQGTGKVMYRIKVEAFWESPRGKRTYVAEDALNISIRTPMTDSNIGLWVLTTMNKQAKQVKEKVTAADKKYQELANE